MVNLTEIEELKTKIKNLNYARKHYHKYEKSTVLHYKRKLKSLLYHLVIDSDNVAYIDATSLSIMSVKSHKTRYYTSNNRKYNINIIAIYLPKAGKGYYWFSDKAQVRIEDYKKAKSLLPSDFIIVSDKKARLADLVLPKYFTYKFRRVPATQVIEIMFSIIKRRVYKQLRSLKSYGIDDLISIYRRVLQEHNFIEV